MRYGPVYMRHTPEYESNLSSFRAMEECVPMTIIERKATYDWVRNGHDLDSNPWGYLDETGAPCNYLRAYRSEYGHPSGPWDQWKDSESCLRWSWELKKYISRN